MNTYIQMLDALQDIKTILESLQKTAHNQVKWDSYGVPPLHEDAIV